MKSKIIILISGFLAALTVMPSLVFAGGDYQLPASREFVAYKIVETLGADASGYKNCFPDMVGRPYEPAVCYLAAKGIVKGYPNGFFQPENSMNRAEAAKLFAVAFVPKNKWYVGNAIMFTDVPANSWYYQFVNTITQQGISDLKPGYEFYPVTFLSQGRLVTWCSNAKAYLTKNKIIIPSLFLKK